MPSKKPHVLVADTYHDILLKAQDHLGLRIPKILEMVFETSYSFKLLHDKKYKQFVDFVDKK